MKRLTSTLLAAAIAATLGASAAWSQGSAAPNTGAAAAGPDGMPTPGARDAAGPSGGTAAGMVSSADRMFVDQAAESGVATVQAGKLAVQRARDPRIRLFAQRMIDDHDTANDELAKLASARGITPPGEPSLRHRKEMDALQKRSGVEFDRAYMKGQVADHQKAVALFDRQSRMGQDAELRQWAAKLLPALREHLQMARADAGDRADARGAARR
jgi:putative membrane protein